jgi:hypothetical protein
MPFKKKPQMTSAEFTAALREAGSAVDHGRIVDVSGKCPGFAVIPAFRNGVLNRNATLSKAMWEREAEIKRRAGSGWSVGGASEPIEQAARSHHRRRNHPRYPQPPALCQCDSNVQQPTGQVPRTYRATASGARLSEVWPLVVGDVLGCV